MFEAGMLSDFGFWLPFGLPVEFLRGLTGSNSLFADKQNEPSRCVDKQNEPSRCVDKQNEPSRCADKQNEHSRCTDKLTNKIKSADYWQPKLTRMLKWQITVNRPKYVWVNEWQVRTFIINDRQEVWSSILCKSV